MTTKLNRIKSALRMNPDTVMTPDEAKQIIADKITSLDWKITSVQEPNDRCIHLVIESDTTIPRLGGSITLWPNDGVVSIYSGNVDVFCSSEQSHVDYFRLLLERHKAQEIADKNRIIIETATALQNL